MMVKELQGLLKAQSPEAVVVVSWADDEECRPVEEVATDFDLGWSPEGLDRVHIRFSKGGECKVRLGDEVRADGLVWRVVAIKAVAWDDSVSYDEHFAVVGYNGGLAADCGVQEGTVLLLPGEWAKV